MEWGSTGELVYERTYSRPLPDGSYETWPDTVQRVVDGNTGLVPDRYIEAGERERLVEMIRNFEIIPAGRHLWASGVSGRQHLFNCWHSGWNPDAPEEHFTFTFLRLMEGGGVGANYTWRQPVMQMSRSTHRVHIVCDDRHPDYQVMLEEGLISDEYCRDWVGSWDVEDSREGWADALSELIQTYYRDAQHENRVFDVSKVRAEGEPLKTFGGTASGPAPLARMLHAVSEILNNSVARSGRFAGYILGLDAMRIDHEIAKCVVSGGGRRSARMSIMHWDDLDIFEFIRSKRSGDHWTTNISVEVDDEFWNLVRGGGDPLDREHAMGVLYEIADGMLTNGEPGIWDSSLSNVGEPNPVTCTNPCGEIPLEEWEQCNLGHINLAAFVDENGSIDEDRMGEAHRLMTRFVIRATYGDVNSDRSAEVLNRNRRVGVGHFGFASLMAMSGRRYERRRDTMAMLHRLRAAVYQEAVGYAHELRIPVPVKTRTIAPTGTIAKMPGVSEGIHPIFSQYFIRRIRLSSINPREVELLEQYRRDGYKIEPCQYADNTMVVEIPTKDALMATVEEIHGEDAARHLVQSAADLSLEDMLAIQEMYQTVWADNAVSFTANVDPNQYTTDSLANTILQFGGCIKGFTIFPETGMPQAPYERLTREEYENYHVHEVADGVDEECAGGACPVR